MLNSCKHGKEQPSAIQRRPAENTRKVVKVGRKEENDTNCINLFNCSRPLIKWFRCRTSHYRMNLFTTCSFNSQLFCIEFNLGKKLLTDDIGQFTNAMFTRNSNTGKETVLIFDAAHKGGSKFAHEETDCPYRFRLR